MRMLALHESTFAPEVLLEPVLQRAQLLTATSAPIKAYGAKTVVLATLQELV